MTLACTPDEVTCQAMVQIIAICSNQELVNMHPLGLAEYNVYIYIYTLYIYIYIYIYIHIYIYIRTYVSVHIYIYAYIHIHIYLYVCIYIYTYVFFLEITCVCSIEMFCYCFNLNCFWSSSHSCQWEPWCLLVKFPITFSKDPSFGDKHLTVVDHHPIPLHIYIYIYILIQSEVLLRCFQYTPRLASFGYMEVSSNGGSLKP